MGKMSLSGIWRGYLGTLVNYSTGRMSMADIALQVVIPALSGVALFLFWPDDANAVNGVASNVVTGVSIISSLMCGVSVMLFQLRVQISSHDGAEATRRECRLIDETFSDVLWSVVVGFAAVILIIVGGVFDGRVPFAHKAMLSAALCLVLNLVAVTCMSLKRINAAYEIVSRVWGGRK